MRDANWLKFSPGMGVKSVSLNPENRREVDSQWVFKNTLVVMER